MCDNDEGGKAGRGKRQEWQAVLDSTLRFGVSLV